MLTHLPQASPIFQDCLLAIELAAFIELTAREIYLYLDVYLAHIYILLPGWRYLSCELETND